MTERKAIARQTVSTSKEEPEKAFLVAVDAQKQHDTWTTEDSLEELEQLADAAGAVVVGKIIQHLTTPAKTHYIGSGKLDELVELQKTTGYEVVIFDDELSPLQQRNLEQALKVKVLDRAALILDIFASRARTREGQLQVELAQHQYLLPRLAGQWSHLERLGGGIGTRGPGETQLETDRRIVHRKIHHLKQNIDTIRKQRMLHREKRRKSGIPVIALVGYTNSGKSTLLNTISKSDIMAEDMLFATLDPTTRRVMLPNHQQVLFTDTVGFIRKLPPALATAFRATLEELDDADILLHIVDITLHNAADQYDVVESILKDLKLDDKPRITVLNKIDRLVDNISELDEKEVMALLTGESDITQENTVILSAYENWGIEKLLDHIIRILQAEK